MFNEGFLSGLLLLLGLIVSIIALFKEDPRADKRKFLKKINLTKVLSILYILLFIIGIILLIIQNFEAKKKEINSFKLLNSIDSIRLNVKNAVIDLDRALVSLSGLRNTLDSLEVKTIQAIKERKESLEEYNKISTQLRKKVEIDELSMIEKGPQIEVFSYDVKLKKQDSLYYTLVVLYKNMGRRVAYDVTYSYNIAWICDSGIVIIESRSSLDSVPLFPYAASSENAKCFLRKYLPSKDIEEKYKVGVLYIKFNFFDKLLNKRDSVEKDFFWNGYKHDGLNFHIGSSAKRNLIFNKNN